jgi:hypothetical protein
MPLTLHMIDAYFAANPWVLAMVGLMFLMGIMSRI